MGAVWAVFAGALAVVAPRDVWSGTFAFVADRIPPLRRHESPAADTT
jgi:hypothetical protein